MSSGMECGHAIFTRVGGDVSPLPMGGLMRRGLYQVSLRVDLEKAADGR